MRSRKDFKGYFGFPGSQPGGTSFRYSSNGIPVWDDPVAIVLAEGLHNQVQHQVDLVACSGPENCKGRRSGPAQGQRRSQRTIGPAQDPAPKSEKACSGPATCSQEVVVQGACTEPRTEASEVRVQEVQHVVRVVALQQPPKQLPKRKIVVQRGSPDQELEDEVHQQLLHKRDKLGRMEPIGGSATKLNLAALLV